MWFDSGVSHEAVLKNDPRLQWPADLYLEGSDQHRGWFQTSLIPAAAIDGRAPYRAVLTHGFAVDGQGKKMSKSRGNVVRPEEIIRDYGADILRLWVAASDYRGDIRISPEIVKLLVDVYRRIRNTLRFLLGNMHEFSASKDRVPYNEMMEIDRWALHALQDLVRDVRAAYGMYEFHRVWKAINTFCAVDMSAGYFDILKDRLYTWHASGKERRSAQTALLEIFNVLVRLVAPLLSFTAEEVWQVFREEHPEAAAAESIFLEDIPDVNASFVSDTLARDWKRLFDVRALVNAELEKARQAGAIRSSLEAETVFSTGSAETRAFLSRYQDVLDMLCIVSRADVSDQPAAGGESSDGLSVAVRKARGRKCARCWRWQEDVSDETGLCARCRNVVNSKGDA